MVIVRQKLGTIVSLVLFIILCGIGAFFGLAHFMTHRILAWYDYLCIFLCLPVGSALLIRIFWNFKKVYFGKGRVAIRYPIRFREHSYLLKEIVSWSENKVKTPSGTYKEIEIRFQNGKHTEISMQEHMGYSDARNYLLKKCKKKKSAGR